MSAIETHGRPECAFRIRAAISKSAIRRNISAIKSAINGSGAALCVAVKADGYGCGAVIMAREAESMGASCFAVATAAEGTQLRRAGIKSEILLLSLCPSSDMDEAVSSSLTPFAFDREYVEALDRAAKARGAKIKVHLAVDTGMGRIGCLPEEAADMARFIQSRENLSLGGTATHFSCADSVARADREYTDAQLSAFLKAIASIKSAGTDPGVCHCAESVALLDRPEARLGMVRAGIVAYGYYPGDMTREYFERKGSPVDLEPVMTVEADVAAVREVKRGSAISYGRTWTAKSNTRLAVVSAGYADGISRSYAPGLVVSINGGRFPVAGRVCMDQLMVDLGADPAGALVRRGDKAILFGSKRTGAAMDAADAAKVAGTIPYEVMTRVSARVPRVAVE